MSNPSILLTGGTGKTGRRIAAQLAGKGLKARIASPTGAGPAGHQGVRFDWLDESTYADAVAGISAVYLLAPAGVAEPLPAMQPFLDQALKAGVHRFVLLSASSLEEDGPMMGKVHAYLRRNAPEWAVLRPTWFMQNFSEQQHLPTIRDEGRIYSATGDGRVPFIDADDIGASARSVPDYTLR
ncbi:NAD(P)H-binding protein [Microvirga arsenatis]|uniref:NAD(P)H-binding protein n=1 Tax=Microvirga arsenatis TaxID=2692265 RepID=A0ABW9Z376_9HYPH|nr:NAD(P)H-binding protein [Microvirga arsenatis]NBJ13652.1 NAD(P)H-binding protein [Microvirga arsenatis]NBJ27149.1 NAD(P)H-binding protein [Microvirga arsenatis]